MLFRVDAKSQNAQRNIVIVFKLVFHAVLNANVVIAATIHPRKATRNKSFMHKTQSK
jgi:hypothetical protein